ncbi:hypothetical protein ATJ97_2263 [Georgenia soli]|uniref:Lipoprotein LpqN n=1 Tax=Georgenia soli TaxID=638953 RepID=A0A2A9END4_9MICO|nr:hypothetical protein [Georgenia soli]PFG39750.1 hypothetical protein ATJ97_2263 [Georgenia soli]
MNKSVRVAVVTGVSLLVAALAACSSDESPDAAGTPSASAEMAAEPTAEAPAVPGHGDIITAGQLNLVPDELTVFEIPDGEAVVVDPAQPLPQPIVDYLDSLTVTEPPEKLDMTDADNDPYMAKPLAATDVTERTGRSLAWVAHVALYDTDGKLLETAYTVQVTGEASDLRNEDVKSGDFDAFATYPDKAQAEAGLEALLARVSDRSVYDVLPAEG